MIIELVNKKIERDIAKLQYEDEIVVAKKINANNAISGVINSYDILPKTHFLKRLWIEKRRSDRSKSPLSVALFYLEAEHWEFNGYFLKLIQKKIRETDIIGYLDWNTIAIIFTDTNEDGLRQCLEKIAGQNEKALFSIKTATYPNDLFESLLSENQDQPPAQGLSPLDCDDYMKYILFKEFIKRGIDIVGALVGMLLFSPIILLTAIAVKATSKGPVIFKQLRLGKGGVPFVFYKFRSMYSNMDDKIHREYVSQLIQGKHDLINQGGSKKPLYKIKSDPRITPVGRFIRKTSIDEIPQLFNVLKGNMSLVGPRPPLPYEAEKYEAWHLRRILEIKPGITGLWQVEGRSKTSFNDMVRLDLCYIRDWSLTLDLRILIKTIKVVFGSPGAC